MTAQLAEVTWQLPRHLAAVPVDQTVREQAAIALLLLRDLPAAMRAARIARGLPQAHAAQQVGISPTTWCHLEHGRIGPGAGVLRALLDWLAAEHHPDGHQPPRPPAQDETVARLRRVRRQLGLTQHEVARQLGVTKSAVSHWETGAKSLRTAHLGAVLAWLDRHDPEAAR